MLLYNTTEGPLVVHDGKLFRVGDGEWDALFHRDDLFSYLQQQVASATPLPGDFRLDDKLRPPVGNQEIWAAGVTYYRSRTARMEESYSAGGSDFYDRVYHADRPELFLKATPHRAVGTGASMHLRRDSKWVVPEPELTLAITRSGKIIGYTIGNDLSCRDIEGENPLYLPQAKTFNACAAVGPGILVREEPLPSETEIELTILHEDSPAFSGSTRLDQLKKSPDSLVEYLYRENSFPDGSLLMTGTGIVPPDDFSLQAGDEVRIRIEPIGTLSNRMA